MNDYETFIGSQLEQYIGYPKVRPPMCSPPLPQAPLSCLMCTKPQCLRSFSPSSHSPLCCFTLAVAVHPQNCVSAKVFHLCRHELLSSISFLLQLLDTLLAVQCISVYRLYSLGSDYPFLKDTMMPGGNF